MAVMKAVVFGTGLVGLVAVAFVSNAWGLVAAVATAVLVCVALLVLGELG